MADELIDEAGAETPGDEWTDIDVGDTEADQIARQSDREFAAFRKRITNNEQFKVADSVFDDATYAALYQLVQGDVIDAFGGPLSTGKEANVYLARGGPAAGRQLDETTPAIAVKIYRITAAEFDDMQSYLRGDPRFEELTNRRQVVLAWTQKEYANLRRALEAGVRVPTPLAVERNVLAMEFIGADSQRGRRLAEVDVENPETAFEVVREYLRRLYAAGLVHGDLSEYNILVHDGELVVIDVGQAMTVHHPNAEEFLRRDCANVASFFTRQGHAADGDELYQWVLDQTDTTAFEDTAE